MAYYIHMIANKTELTISRRGIISGYYHPQYPKYVIVAYQQADKMLGLVALQADIGVDEQY